MGGAQIKLGDPVCSDNRRPDGAVWFLGRTGFSDSPVVMKGLPSECMFHIISDSEGSSAWWKFLLTQ